MTIPAIIAMLICKKSNKVAVTAFIYKYCDLIAEGESEKIRVLAVLLV